MAYIRCGGGGIPATLKSDMNAVFNKKFETSTDYPPNTWADTVNLMGALPIRSASGTIATFNDGADLVPLKSLTLTVTPSQSGTGDPSPANPRPLNSFSSLKIEHTGANMLDGARAKDYALDTFSTSTSGTNDTGKYYTLRAGNPINGIDLFPWLKFKENTQYTLIFKLGKDNTATSTNIKVNYTDGTGLNLTRTSTSSDPEETEIFVFTTSASKSVKNITGVYQSGTVYLYYENIGIFSGVVTAQDFATFTGDPHTLDLGSTVYGVTGDCVTGEFEETYKLADLSTMDWDSGAPNQDGYIRFVNHSAWGDKANGYRLFCDKFPVKTSLIPSSPTSIGISGYSSNTNIYIAVESSMLTGDLSTNAGRNTAFRGWISDNGLQILYELATPTELTTDPVEIESFKGGNNIWCDKDSSVAVEYRADIDLLITELGG